MILSPATTAIWLTLTIFLVGAVLIQAFVIIHVHQQLLDNENQDLSGRH